MRSETLMSDRAAATFGGDVLRVGAFSERNCDRGAFVCEPVLDGHRPDRQVVTVDDKISDEFSGLTSALLRNAVIAHRGADFLVPHESHEDSGATPASAWRWA
jgi:hypothetical protein